MTEYGEEEESSSAITRNDRTHIRRSFEFNHIMGTCSFAEVSTDQANIPTDGLYRMPSSSHVPRY